MTVVGRLLFLPQGRGVGGKNEGRLSAEVTERGEEEIHSMSSNLQPRLAVEEAVWLAFGGPHFGLEAEFAGFLKVFIGS